MSLTADLLGDAELDALVDAMKADGMSEFWQTLVKDQGPHGRRVATKLLNTMPERYRRAVDDA